MDNVTSTTSILNSSSLVLLCLDNVSQLLKEELDRLRHLGRLLLEEHGRVLELDPVAQLRPKSPV